MIALTAPIQVTAVLGSAGKINYDRLVLTTIHYDVVQKSISGSCQLVVSANPAAAPIAGNYNIPTTGGAILTFNIPNLLFTASLALSTAQQTAIQTLITNAQNAVEAGLISVSIVAGVQFPGS